MEFFGDKVTDAEIETIIDKSTGAISNPRTWKDILARPAAEREYWTAAKMTELKSIIEREVVTQPLTAEQRRKLGVPVSLDRRPVPLHMLYSLKPSPASAAGGGSGLGKFKCRLVLTGSSRFLRRGRDFWQTFTAAPLCSTARIMAFIIVQCGWGSSAADIVCAYLMAKLAKEEQVVIQMDEELRSYSKDGKEELRPVLQGAQYGHPASGMRFEKERNKHVLSPHFNFANEHEACSVTQSKYDPSLFIIVFVTWPDGDGQTNNSKPKRDPAADFNADAARKAEEAEYHKGGDFGGGRSTTVRALLLCYVDDLDLASETPKLEAWIWKTMGIRFELKRTDPKHMLGLLRELNKDRTSMKISMPAYIEGMYEQFKEFLPTKGANADTFNPPATPVPPGLYLTNENVPDVPAAEKKPRQEALLKVLGKALWATRMVHLTASFGVNSCCRMVANPTEEALAAAYHVVAYLYGKKDDGIVITKMDTPQLVAYYDASNKGDPADCDRAQAGYIVMLGGPTDWRSFRLPHVGLSAQHNELMAMAFASQSVCWHRYVLEDMGFGHWVEDASVVLGDNDAATTVAREQRLTIQNRYYSRLCNYAKECCELGKTCPRRAGTEDNISDGFTKAVTVLIVKAHYDLMMGRLRLPPLPPKPRG